jgi:N-acetylmuramoyl-L-alanine amidase
MKIYLSPSTQENNVGAGSYGTEEKRMNQLADVLEPLLRKYGHEILRNKPTMTLKEVKDASNAFKPDLHLALHSNAGNGLARGCEIYCYRYGGQGEQYARTLYKYLEPLTPTPDRGVKEGYNFYGVGKHMYEVTYTTAPAVLIEIAFHDNGNDAAWIVANMTAIATAITNAINDAAGIETVIDNYKAKYDALVNEVKTLIAKYEKEV